jgi:hypothetical protein
MSARGHAVLGASLILLGLVLVPFIWACGKGVADWNVLVFGLIAFGASQVGAAMGRWTRQRLAGIAMTILAVLAALSAIAVVTAATCS